MTRIALMIASLAALLVRDAGASGLSGAELYAACTTPVQYSADDAMCLSYTDGVMDGMYVAIAWSGLIAICMPTTLPSAIEARMIVEKFMREHPEKLTENSAPLTALAIANAFQCPQKR